MIHILTKEGAPEHLGDWIPALIQKNNSLSWVRWLTAAQLGRSEKFLQPIQYSLSGRIFWPQGEVRWQRLEQTIRLVYISDNPPLRQNESIQCFSLKKAHIDMFYLLDLPPIKGVDFSALPQLKRNEKWMLRLRQYETQDKGSFNRFCSIEAKVPCDLRQSNPVEEKNAQG